MRYVQPPATKPQLYFSKLLPWKEFFKRPATERWVLITEGEIKADCACKMGFGPGSHFCCAQSCGDEDDLGSCPGLDCDFDSSSRGSRHAQLLALAHGRHHWALRRVTPWERRDPRLHGPVPSLSVWSRTRRGHAPATATPQKFPQTTVQRAWLSQRLQYGNTSRRCPSHRANAVQYRHPGAVQTPRAQLPSCRRESCPSHCAGLGLPVHIGAAGHRPGMHKTTRRARLTQPFEKIQWCTFTDRNWVL